MKRTAKTIMKKMTAWTMTAALGVSLATGIGTSGAGVVQAAEKGASKITGSVADGNYDYGRAWQQTLMFYEFQKNGNLENTIQRNNWKGNSCLSDGEDVGRDLTGGWNDAGDHVKFNLPMAYAASMLAWSYLEYTDTYKKSGQDVYMLDELKWVNDYLNRCCDQENNCYYYQVGDGDIDHNFWGGPELLDEPYVKTTRELSRPTYTVTDKAKDGGSAVCADTAASLAQAYMVFKDIDPEFAKTSLDNAKWVYEMALKANNDDGYAKGAKGYYASSHWQDEFSWGGVWLYQATGDKKYLETAESYTHMWGGELMVGRLTGNVWTQCWDDVRYGSMLLIAELDPESEAGAECREGIEYNLDYWSTGVIEGNGTRARGKFTPKGLVMINDWGSLRYAAAQAAMAMFYTRWADADQERVENYTAFAKAQADYLLGSTGRSYVVGFDETSPRNPHHRTADGAWKNSPLKCPNVNRHTLVGAVVGGPRADESYEDDRNNYCTNEVANDYNAGPVCLMASMYDLYGGTIDPDINAVETVGQEYYVDGCNYQKGTDSDGNDFCEVKLTIENHTAWPARPSKDLKFRYFVNIKDALKEGATPDQFKVVCYYAQRKSLVTQLIPWNEDEGIYYVEVAFGQSDEQKAAYDKAGISYIAIGEADPYMYPGGDVECRADMQLRVEAPGTWDYTKSPSYLEIKDTEVDEKLMIKNIPVYEGEELVGGMEPAKEGKVDLTVPTVDVDEIVIGTIGTEQVTQVTQYEVKSGGTCQIDLAISPANATDKSVTWKSMDPSIATVDENGVVTGVKKGSVSIIVTANGGGVEVKAANCVVDVDGGVEDTFAQRLNIKPSDSDKTTAAKTTETKTGAVTTQSSNKTTQGKTETTQNGVATTQSGNKTTQEKTTQEKTTQERTTQTGAGTTQGKTTQSGKGTTESAVNESDKTTRSGQTTTQTAAKTTQTGKVTTQTANKTTQKDKTESDKTTRSGQADGGSDKTTEKNTSQNSDNSNQADATTQQNGNSGNAGQNDSSGNTGGNGSSGNAGQNGSSGNAGGNGNSGNAGQNGSSRNTGGNGNSGNAGQNGSSGNTGGNGNSGNAGQNGSSGNAGGNGNSGNTGNNATTQQSTTAASAVEITVPDDSIEMAAGKKKSLTPDIAPQNLADKALEFETSDKKVVALSNATDSSVKLVAKKAGKVTITVRLKNNPSVSTQMTVVVKPAKVTKLSKRSVTANSVKLSWKKQKGVDGYVIYRYDAAKKYYKKCGKTKKNQVVVKGLKSRTKNIFKVRAYKKISGKIKYGTASKALRVTTR